VPPASARDVEHTPAGGHPIRPSHDPLRGLGEIVGITGHGSPAIFLAS